MAHVATARKAPHYLAQHAFGYWLGARLHCRRRYTAPTRRISTSGIARRWKICIASRRAARERGHDIISLLLGFSQAVATPIFFKARFAARQMRAFRAMIFHFRSYFERRAPTPTLPKPL